MFIFKTIKNDFAELERYGLKDIFWDEERKKGDNDFTFEETDEQSDSMTYNTIKQVSLNFYCIQLLTQSCTKAQQIEFC